MKWLGENPFHTLLVLTEKPGSWPAWRLAVLPLVLDAAAGGLWAHALQQPSWGWAVALGLLLLATADWALLATLPRWGLSFGLPQPPWIGLVILRWLLALLALPLARIWPAPAAGALLGIQLLGWVVAAYATMVEPFRLQVTRRRLRSARLSNPGTEVRIVQLSDLHVERLTLRERALPFLVADLAPDILVLTGDFLNTSYNQDPQARDELCHLLKEFHAPGGIYAIWGTVEVDHPDFLRPALEQAGVIVLEDRSVEVEIRGHRLWILGVSCSKSLDADGVRLQALMNDAPPLAFRLLLYHRPDLMPQAAAMGVDLFLAGHTHGGQWRIPGFGAVLTSSRFWKRYEGGYYHEGDTHLYVSRGIGMEGFGTPRTRLFCPPEVVCITLEGEENERP